MNRAIALTCGITAAVSFSTMTVSAQTSTNVVDSKSDWSVFVENEPLTCWIVSKPTKTVNMRSGKRVAVNRGDIRLFVTYLPKDGVIGQVSFTGGYPFNPDSILILAVGSSEYKIYPKGEYAWPDSSDVDAKIRASMKRGASAVIKAQSARSTQTTDTFSLVGFTAALAEAEKRCK
jgi:hypothetical protein